MGCLNPFKFRAGIYLNELSTAWKNSVLIPLNSGQVFTCCFNLDSSVDRLLSSLNRYEC